VWTLKWVADNGDMSTSADSAPNGFDLIFEVEPATRPDLTGVRHQIGVMSRTATAFLIPDNHIGRATVSSIAVAHEVALMGGRAIACLNARDRNQLGFRRDLLTADAYGVNDFLFVYGDRPESGARSDDLTVRLMLEQARVAGPDGSRRRRIGVAAGPGPLPPWKRDADFVCVQVEHSLDRLLAWRDGARFDGPVYAGVLVLAGAAMARKLSADVPQLAVSADIIDTLERSPHAGVDMACAHIEAIRDSGAFDGVHVIPVARYREVAARLEQMRR
jgi:methylenetetrahydrofolate reductase (NADPH)